jgi:hypothetical protein
VGPAAEALGLVQGAVIDRAEDDLMFGERKAADGARLGRAPGDGAAKAHEIYQRLAAAEPHADEGRRRELRMEAQRQVRQSPLYYDLTVSLSKSISVFHASLGENVRQALMRGDAAEAARWAACAEDMDAAISEANNAALAYIQREVACARIIGDLAAFFVVTNGQTLAEIVRNAGIEARWVRPPAAGDLTPGEVVMEMVSRTSWPASPALERRLHRGPLRWENSRTLQMRRSELDRYLIELLDQEIWLQGVKYMLADPDLKNRPWPHYRDEDRVWV